MNLTKLASGGYDLKVQTDTSFFEFKSGEFDNANQLYKLLCDGLVGFPRLKKSTFYGVKFEETVPGVFEGSHRITGHGTFTFQFFGEGSITATSESCKGACDGEGGCGSMCCKKIEEQLSSPLPAANEDSFQEVGPISPAADQEQLKVESGFTIGELGAGCLSVSDKLGRLQGQYKFSGLSGSSATLSNALGKIDALVGPEVMPVETPSFYYQEMSGEYVAVYRGFLLAFVKGQPTLKDTFLGWLKNILG